MPSNCGFWDPLGRTLFLQSSIFRHPLNSGWLDEWECLKRSCPPYPQAITTLTLKLVFPVRLADKKRGSEECLYTMNFFSRLFEFGYVDKEKRKDEIVTKREYTVVFSTILGELFAHNLLTKNYDWVDTGFYKLPYGAQVFYRRFLLHNNFSSIPISLENISAKLDYRDHNETNLPKTTEQSVLKPLKDFGLISSYEKEEGLGGD